MNSIDGESAGLQLILGPIDEAEFFAEYWEKSPLHISRNNPEHFSQLLSLQKVETLLSSQAISFPAVQLTRRSDPIDLASYTDDSRRILPQRLIELYREGATIVVSQAHERIMSLADFRRDMLDAFSMRCQTNVYLSPPGKQGFNAHYDSHDVFILQVLGSKLFNFYAGGTELPYSHDSFQSERHACGELQESIMLEAGDTLYIPRGVMHDAVAQDTSSLHITLGVYAVTLRDVMLELVQQLTLQDAVFRQSVPRSWLEPSAEAVEKQAQSQTQTQTQTQAQAGLPDRALAENLNTVFSEQQLKQALSTIVDSMAIDSAPDCLGMMSHATSRPTLALSTTVRLKRALILNTEKSGPVLRCRTHGQVLEFSYPLGTAVEVLMSSEKTVISQLPEIDDDQKLAVCQRLLHANLLEVVIDH